MSKYFSTPQVWHDRRQLHTQRDWITPLQGNIVMPPPEGDPAATHLNRVRWIRLGALALAIAAGNFATISHTNLFSGPATRYVRAEIISTLMTDWQYAAFLAAVLATGSLVALVAETWLAQNVRGRIMLCAVAVIILACAVVAMVVPFARMKYILWSRLSATEELDDPSGHVGEHLTWEECPRQKRGVGMFCSEELLSDIGCSTAAIATPMSAYVRRSCAIAAEWRRKDRFGVARPQGTTRQDEFDFQRVRAQQWYLCRILHPNYCT